MKSRISELSVSIWQLYPGIWAVCFPSPAFPKFLLLRGFLISQIPTWIWLLAEPPENSPNFALGQEIPLEFVPFEQQNPRIGMSGSCSCCSVGSGIFQRIRRERTDPKNLRVPVGIPALGHPSLELPFLREWELRLWILGKTLGNGRAGRCGCTFSMDPSRDSHGSSPAHPWIPGSSFLLPIPILAPGNSQDELLGMG